METEINTMFNKILKQIEEMKTRYQKEYKFKADEIYSSFSFVFFEYIGQMKAMSKVENKLKQMDQLYNLNDYDVIKEYLIRKDSLLFQTYCAEQNKALEQYQAQIEAVKKQICFRFEFNNSINERDIDTMINQHINVQIVEDALMFDPQLKPKKLELQITSTEVERQLEQDQPEQQDASQIVGGDHTNQEITQLVNKQDLLIEEESKVLDESESEKSIAVTFSKRPQSPSNKNRRALAQVKRLGLSGSQKLFKCQSDNSFYYALDRIDLKIKLFYGDKVFQQFPLPTTSSLKDQKTIMVGNRIFLFEATDTTYSSQIYEFNQESKSYVPLSEQLQRPKRRLGLCPQSNRYIIFLGDQENNKSDRAPLERYDTHQCMYEEIYGLNAGYIVCCVNERYLYAFPISLNTSKTQTLDLKQLDETHGFAVNKKVYAHPQKPNAYVPKWEKVSHKLPVQFRVNLTCKSQAIQVNYEEILITSSKVSYIYNFKKEEFTHYVPNIGDEEFLDGIYKCESNSTLVMGFCQGGLYTFDCMGRKWTLYNEIHVKNAVD